MAKYYYDDENNGRIYIKDIDFAEGTLTFTSNKNEAYKGRGGYYADATRDMIRRNFKKDYPQVANVNCDDSDWY